MPCWPFVLDFFCPALNLAIEVDGAVHDAQLERDRERTAFLEARGFRVIRFRNEEVLADLIRVVSEIRNTVRSMHCKIPPLPLAGEGEARSAATSRG